jgi:hypothetical protein
MQPHFWRESNLYSFAIPILYQLPYGAILALAEAEVRHVFGYIFHAEHVL